jgi:hypothetical protein
MGVLMTIAQGANEQFAGSRSCVPVPVLAIYRSARVRPSGHRSGVCLPKEAVSPHAAVTEGTVENGHRVGLLAALGFEAH